MMINEHKTSRAWLKFEHFFHATWKIIVRVKTAIKTPLQERCKVIEQPKACKATESVQWMIWNKLVILSDCIWHWKKIEHAKLSRLFFVSFINNVKINRNTKEKTKQEYRPKAFQRQIKQVLQMLFWNDLNVFRNNDK